MLSADVPVVHYWRMTRGTKSELMAVTCKNLNWFPKILSPLTTVYKLRIFMVYKRTSCCHLTNGFEIGLLLLLSRRKISGEASIRDCNPGPVFSIPGFGIEKFLIPGSRRDYICSWPLPRGGGILVNSTKLDETKSAAQDLTITSSSAIAEKPRCSVGQFWVAITPYSADRPISIKSNQIEIINWLSEAS